MTAVDGFKSQHQVITAESYLAIQAFTQFSPDPQIVVITPGYYDMRGAWMILCSVHKTGVGEKLDG